MHLERADAAYFSRCHTKAEDGGFWTLHRMGIEPPTAKTKVSDAAAVGLVAGGRWIVQCPFCSGVQLGNPESQDRVCCVGCGNKPVGGRWAKVVWPDVQEIEAALVKRPLPQNMNWSPHEAVEHLYAENVERGVQPLSSVPVRYRPVVAVLVDVKRNLNPAHAIAVGTVVHENSDWHPAKAVRLMRAMGHNLSDSDVRAALFQAVGR